MTLQQTNVMIQCKQNILYFIFQPLAIEQDQVRPAKGESLKLLHSDDYRVYH